MSTNWKTYIHDPKFLIALLPGLEIARDNIAEEIEDIRSAISGKQEAVAEAPASKQLSQPKRRYKQKADKPEVAGFAPALNLTQAEFIQAVAEFHGGTATNTQIKAAAWKNRKQYGGLNDARRLSVAIAGALKQGVIERSAPSTIKLAQKAMHAQA